MSIIKKFVPSKFRDRLIEENISQVPFAEPLCDRHMNKRLPSTEVKRDDSGSGAELRARLS